MHLYVQQYYVLIKYECMIYSHCIDQIENERAEPKKNFTFHSHLCKSASRSLASLRCVLADGRRLRVCAESSAVHCTSTQYRGRNLLDFSSEFLSAFISRIALFSLVSLAVHIQYSQDAHDKWRANCSESHQFTLIETKTKSLPLNQSR